MHVSQISRAHVEKPADALKIGQEITAKVVDLNEADKKISLSMKVLEPVVEEVVEETTEEVVEEVIEEVTEEVVEETTEEVAE